MITDTQAVMQIKRWESQIETKVGYQAGQVNADKFRGFPAGTLKVVGGDDEELALEANLNGQVGERIDFEIYARVPTTIVDITNATPEELDGWQKISGSWSFFSYDLEPRLITKE